MKPYRLAVDIGGTFVDAIEFDVSNQSVRLEKSPTTPQGCFRHQVLLRGCGQWYRCGRERVARPSEQENLDPQPQRNRRRQEDVSKGEPSRGETGLHSRSSDLTSELQSSVRSDEVVIATEQLQVLIEPLRRASVGKCSS